jgi:hypothetical protein
MPPVSSRHVEQRRVNRHGPQVREQVETLAQRQQSLLGTNLCLGIGPLRPTDRAEQHRVGRTARRQGLRRQRRLHLIDCRASDQVLGKREVVAVACCYCLQHAHAFARDFRTDAVAAEDDDRCFDAHVCGIPLASCESVRAYAPFRNERSRYFVAAGSLAHPRH